MLENNARRRRTRNAGFTEIKGAGPFQRRQARAVKGRAEWSDESD